jgi:hypothetical protein
MADHSKLSPLIGCHLAEPRRMQRNLKLKFNFPEANFYAHP